ncbi:MAG: GNAT family N-acetyltransferase [Bacteroidota bacterium]
MKKTASLRLDFSPFPKLSTPRLLLRRIRPGDAPELFFLRSDPAVLRYINRSPDPSAGHTRVFIRKLHQLEKDKSGLNWAITLRGEKKLIGNICLWNIKKEHYRAEIGYVLHPAYQGKGIMDEAVKAVIRAGFKRFGLHSLEAHVNPLNKASIRLLKRNGFAREGYFRQNFFYEGKFLDSAVYSLLAR